MGVSTNGQICYGIIFDDGFEFPWDAEKWGGDIDEWWRDVNGYEPGFNPYTDEGNHREGVVEDDPRIYEYHSRMQNWMKEHPIPVKLINYCSGEVPMYILAVSCSCITSRRGHPIDFDPKSLTLDGVQGLLLGLFCTKYGIETEDEPKWWLSSFWG